MNNIQVEPYIPDEDYDNPAMVTDFYEFSMANSLFMHGCKDTIMVFKAEIVEDEEANPKL